MMTVTDDRIARERDFHNKHRFGEHDNREHINKWYAAVDHCNHHQDALVRELARNARVLEYGCADGPLSLDILKLPSIANQLYGIDISDAAIDKANKKVADRGIGNASFLAMNAEALDFGDNTFDLVFGRGIIHHLDLEKCFSEVRRVLKPGGTVIFSEPMGHNPVLNWYRNRTPEMRTPDEHPLVAADFELARQYFQNVTCEFFGGATLVGVKVPTLMPLMRSIDKLVLSIPPLGKYAWFVLLTMKKAE